MRLSLLLLGASFALASASAIPGQKHHVVHERRSTLPASFDEGYRLDKNTVLPVRIGLAQSNLHIADALLMEVSDHTSPRYGKYYTAEEVHDVFAPSTESVDAVREWLEASGISPDRVTLSANKQWLQFDAKAGELEDLLNTKYLVHPHAATGNLRISCREYSVPKSVRQHIDYITPGVKWLEVAPQDAKTKRSLQGGRQAPVSRPIDEPIEHVQAADASLSQCDKYITPNCIKAMYKIPAGKNATPGNELGIFEEGDYYSQEDLNLFFANLYPEIPLGTHPIPNLIDGAIAPVPVAEAGAESSLDFQISYPIIWPQNSVLFQTEDPHYAAENSYAGFLNNFLDAVDGSYCSETSPEDPPYPDPAPGGYKGQRMCGVYRPTNVVSISYGEAEADLPISYQRRQCMEWLKLGLQGTSVLVSSGDSGVAGRGGDPTPSNCLGANGTVFAPQFPANCPYITAVGATYLPPGADAQSDAEVAVTRFPSGGGFSNIYATTAYQKHAVQKYFDIAQPPYPYYSGVDNSSFGANGGIYNRGGRAYPDVAAIGDNVVIFAQGKAARIGGTSASAPAFASILTLINEERLAVGLPTVGFVNPILYAHPEVFHDITVGNNSGCGTPGFYAAPGWDPVTGLGTPVYPKLLDLFMGRL